MTLSCVGCLCRDRLVAAADGDAEAKAYMTERLEVQANLASDEGKASLLQDVIKGRRTEIVRGHALSMLVRCNVEI